MAKESKVQVSQQSARPQLPEETYSPLVDIFEDNEGSTHVVAEVPGAKAEKVDVRVDKGTLIIQADARDALPEEYEPTYVGFRGVYYYRAFALSDEIDRDRIEASLADGVLRIKLPRAAAARTRKIEIRAE
jgi:HSP20 family molecular chaperone IbpA